MGQLSQLESNRLVNRISYIRNMRSKLIGNPLANDFSSKFSRVENWKVSTVNSSMIDQLEEELRNWLKMNGQFFNN